MALSERIVITNIWKQFWYSWHVAWLCNAKFTIVLGICLRETSCTRRLLLKLQFFKGSWPRKVCCISRHAPLLADLGECSPPILSTFTDVLETLIWLFHLRKTPALAFFAKRTAIFHCLQLFNHQSNFVSHTC